MENDTLKVTSVKLLKDGEGKSEVMGIFINMDMEYPELELDYDEFKAHQKIGLRVDHDAAKDAEGKMVVHIDGEAGIPDQSFAMKHPDGGSELYYVPTAPFKEAGIYTFGIVFDGVLQEHKARLKLK